MAPFTAVAAVMDDILASLFITGAGSHAAGCVIKRKFHYADFPETYPEVGVIEFWLKGTSRVFVADVTESRHSGIWALNLTTAQDNWLCEAIQGKKLAYKLSRPDGRPFNSQQLFPTNSFIYNFIRRKV